MSKYDYDIIRDYLHGLVDKETDRNIRELIRTDDVARNIAAGILQMEHEFNGNEEEMEAYIEALRQKQLKLVKKGGNERRTWMRLAAAILVVVVSGAVVWLMNRGDLLEKELASPYPLATLDRGSPGEEAYALYINSEFKRAISEFAKVPMDANVAFYKGLSHLYVGEYNDAAVMLDSEILKSSRYYDQASWFRALALIKADKKSEAKEILERIGSNPANYKSTEARRLLEVVD